MTAVIFFAIVLLGLESAARTTLEKAYSENSVAPSTFLRSTEMEVMETKVCSKCGEEKPLEEFYKASYKREGEEEAPRVAACKPCTLAECKKRRDANKDKINAGRREATKKRQQEKWEARLEHTGFRVCCRCEETKPLSEYNKDQKDSFGIKQYCKVCAAEYWDNYHSKVKEGVAGYAPDPDLLNKKCSRCGEEKPVSEFTKRKHSKDGYRSTCNSCKIEMTERWRDENRKQDPSTSGSKTCTECGAEKPIEAFAIDSGGKDGRRTACKECVVNKYYWSLSQEERSRKSRKWYLENWSHLCRERRLRYLKDRDQAAAQRQSRRERLEQATSVDGSATREDIEARWDYYGGICWICRVREATDIDHVKPLAVGGTNHASNLRPACKQCNCSKNAMWPIRPSWIAHQREEARRATN